MSEVTWKATIVGAFVLFLIGLVVATSLNYAETSLKSIKAGLRGPYDCQFDYRVNDTKLCNETIYIAVQPCIYMYVNYTDQETGVTVSDIKLAISYIYDRADDKLKDRTKLNSKGEAVHIGRVSRQCGDH